jgi:hypothetical protein
MWKLPEHSAQRAELAPIFGIPPAELQPMQPATPTPVS